MSSTNTRFGGHALDDAGGGHAAMQSALVSYRFLFPPQPPHVRWKHAPVFGSCHQRPMAASQSPASKSDVQSGSGLVGASHGSCWDRSSFSSATRFSMSLPSQLTPAPMPAHE